MVHAEKTNYLTYLKWGTNTAMKNAACCLLRARMSVADAYDLILSVGEQIQADKTGFSGAGAFALDDSQRWWITKTDA